MTVQVLGRRLPSTATYATLLGAALLLLLVSVAAAFWQVEQEQAHNRAVRHSIDVRAAARLIEISVQSAETGQRGYMLTGQESYLTPYEDVRGRIPAQLDAFDRVTADSAELHDTARRLRVLVENKLQELDETIRLKRAGRANRAMAILRTDLGLHVMNEIRDLVEGLLSSEQLDLNNELSAAERAGDTLRLIVLAAAALLATIGVLLVVSVRSGMHELRASRDQAQAANERLVREMGARRQAETKVLHMQRMEAIGQITGGVAHDFNNMLAVITSALALMQRRLARGDANVSQFIDSANDAARRAAVLVARLLAFARRAPLSPAAVNPNQLVSGMSELLRRTLGEQIEMETVLAGGLWNVYADVSQLENAIVNICVNARDAMESRGGGKLTIETANTYLDENYAALNPDVAAGQYVMIAITDTGAGMTPDVMVRAFEPFFTTKENKGTGLGLSHVHGFIKQSGGHVAIYSEVGQGTTVKLYLPRSQRTETAVAEEAPRPDTPHGDGGTLILAVEDDARVRTMTVAALCELGYAVIDASSGPAALDLLAQHPNVSLILTDIVMPEMSGRALAEEAKRRMPSLKVLYTTGYTQNAIVHNGVVDADATLLMKPYSLDQLARKVRAALDQR